MSQVTVMCPGGRRCKVKVTPNTVLLQVLEQTCARQQLDPAFFILKHHAKRLDLSIPLRYSGIPNNAHLELVKVDTPRRESGEVVVAVQCADGTRVQATFHSNTSLLEVLSQLKLDCSPHGMEPSLVCLREEVVGIRALKLKTLKDIGLSSGKGILRLRYQPFKLEEDDVKKEEGEKKGGGGKEGEERKGEGGEEKEGGGREEEAGNDRKSGTDKESEDDDKGSETKLEEEEQRGKGQEERDDLVKEKVEKTEKDTEHQVKEDEEEEEVKEPCLKKLTLMKKTGIEEKRLSPMEEGREVEEKTHSLMEEGRKVKDKTLSPMEGGRVMEEKKLSPMEEGRGMEDQVLFPAHPISYFPPGAVEEEEAMSGGKHPPPSASQPPTIRLGEEPGDATTTLIQHTLQKQSLHFPPEVIAAQLEELQFSQLAQLPGFFNPHPRAPPLKQHKVYDEPCEREVAVFHLDDPMPLTPTKELPDSFFDHTVMDMHVMHSDLKKQARVSDAPLMTRAMREVRNEMKLEKYTKSIVRVYFSDRWVLQASFRPKESLKTLVKLIRENLTDPELKFHLYTTPPKHILQNGRVTFAEAGFIPAAIVHVGVRDGCLPPRLSTACLQAARCSPLQAEVVQARERRPHSEGKPLSSADSCDIPKPKRSQKYAAVESEGGGGGSRGATPGSGPGAQGGKKVPKWFKLGH